MWFVYLTLISEGMKSKLTLIYFVSAHYKSCGELLICVDLSECTSPLEWLFFSDDVRLTAWVEHPLQLSVCEL